MRFYLVGYRWIASFLIVLGLILGQSTIVRAASRLTLTWSDRSTNEDGFKVERKTDTTGAYTQIITEGANVTSFIDSTVTAGTTYCYRVRAFNSAGNSAYSNEACGTASIATFTLTVTNIGSGTVSSSPAGISCGSDCFESYTSPLSVTFTATPASGYTFSGWSGGCSGTGTCTILANTNLSVTATFTTTPPPPSTSGPSVAYGFNEGSGTTVADASGNERTGTIYGSGVTWTTGKYGDALAFTDNTGRVTSNLRTHATVRSYSLWTLRTGDGGSGLGRMFDKHTTGIEVELLKNNATADAYTYERAWSEQTASWSIPRPSADVWHHIVVIYDESSIANNPKIYVDGVAQTVTRTRAPSGSPLTNTDRYVLGNRKAGDRGWEGKLDNLRIYDRALTATEIATDRTTAVTP